MATLKKGIIGTPKGKIANLMSYERNGIGVLQGIPTVLDSKKRTWNLYRARFEVLILNLWLVMPQSFKDKWSVFNDLYPSPFDFFKSYYYNYFYANSTLNVDKIVYAPFQSIDQNYYASTYDSSTTTLTINLAGDYDFWNPTEKGQIVMNSFYISDPSRILFRNIPTARPNNVSFNIAYLVANEPVILIWRKYSTVTGISSNCWCSFLPQEV
jgi:hypothetical protein